MLVCVMKKRIFPKVPFVLLAGMCLSLFGCQPESDVAAKSPQVDSDTTIRSLGEISRPVLIQVRGFGIVAGLAGTGSSECPPLVREALTKYILQQVADKGQINPGQFIDSKDTAVVEIYGTIPPIASKGQPFDLKVSAMAGTQTISLAGGRLFTAELKSASELAVAEAVMSAPHLTTLAVAQGPVFIDKLNSKNRVRPRRRQSGKRFADTVGSVRGRLYNGKHDTQPDKRAVWPEYSTCGFAK